MAPQQRRGRRPRRAPSQNPVSSSLSSSPPGVEMLERRVFCSVTPADPPPPASNILVKFASDVGDAEKGRLLARHGLTKHGGLDAIGVDVLSVAPGASAVAVAKGIKSAHPTRVEYAEVDALLAPQLTPDDPIYPDQWAHTNINSPGAWDVTTGSPGVAVSVLDTGVFVDHEDLGAGRFLPGWNVAENTSNTTDGHGHGTLVAGTLGAVGNNGIGVAGATWSTMMRPVRVSGNDGYSSPSVIAGGIIYAANQGDRIATIEYQVWSSQAVIDAARYMRSRNGLVIISAGNDGQVYNNIPDSPEVIVAGANGTNDVRAGFSTQGPAVDVAAPGFVYTTNRAGGYGFAGGTSFSAPLTAGVLALMLSANPDIPNVQLERLLFETAVDVGAAGRDIEFGHGRIDAAAAVQAAQAATAEFVVLSDGVTGLTNTSGSVTWTTNFASTGRITYGTRANSMKAVVSDDVSRTSHALTLSNLKKNTQYYYQITSTAADGRTVTTPVKQFRTLNLRGGATGAGGATVATTDTTTAAIYALSVSSGSSWFSSGASHADEGELLAVDGGD